MSVSSLQEEFNRLLRVDFGIDHPSMQSAYNCLPIGEQILDDIEKTIWADLGQVPVEICDSLSSDAVAANCTIESSSTVVAGDNVENAFSIASDSDSDDGYDDDDKDKLWLVPSNAYKGRATKVDECKQHVRKTRRESIQPEHYYQTVNGQYVCEPCNRRFDSNVSLKNHKRVHSTLKRYPCNDCDKVFTYRANLLKHMAINDHQLVRISYRRRRTSL